MLPISRNVAIPDAEIEFVAIRASGPGGQNVNKVSTAIQLRFDIGNSSLPEFYKNRLLKLSDKRISDQGVVVIKAQRYRSQEKNRADALERLQDLVRGAAVTQKHRIPTRPGKAAKTRRLDSKSKRGAIKSDRGKVRLD